MNRLKAWAYHPFLTALYPVLALFANNIEEADAASAFRPVCASLAASILLFLIFRLLYQNGQKAGLAVTTAAILFFSYGHIYGAVKTISFGGFVLGRHRLLAPAFLAVWLLVAWWAARHEHALSRSTTALNVAAVVLVVFPLVAIGDFLITTTNADEVRVDQPTISKASGTAPDIYYLILDGYSRDDTLKQVYNYDNSAFLDSLTGMGFYVAKCSQSNYAQTQLSLASSLNFTYLSTIDEQYADPQNTSRAGLPKSIRGSAARQLLEGLGYTTVAFDSGYYWTNLSDADHFFTQRSNSIDQLGLLSGTNEFEMMLLRTSGGLLVVDAALKLPSFMQPDPDSPKLIHRSRVLYTLDALSKVPRIPGPKFVFAHIVSPHPPFVFARDGAMVEGDYEPLEAYRDQTAYLNGRILAILEQIIKRSENPPLIILQSDHGGIETVDEHRMRILNAYYLPDGGIEKLYAGISPVNTFRVIFNHYFGTDYPLLEDTSYYSTYQRPFDFLVIPEQRSECQ